MAAVVCSSATTNALQDSGRDSRPPSGGTQIATNSPILQPVCLQWSCRFPKKVAPTHIESCVTNVGIRLFVHVVHCIYIVSSKIVQYQCLGPPVCFAEDDDVFFVEANPAPCHRDIVDLLLQSQIQTYPSLQNSLRQKL